VGKDGADMPYSFKKLIKECAKTAYAEKETSTHNNVIDSVAPVIVEVCGLGCHSLVLEIGAGSGPLSRKLNDLCSCSVITTNIVAEDCAAATSNGLFNYHHEMHGPIDFLPEVEGPDLYIFRHVLEHSPCPMFILKQLYGTMKVGALIYIEVPLPDTPCHHEENPNHYSVLTASMWKNLAWKCGFVIRRDFYIDFGIPQADGSTVTDQYYSLILEKL